MHAKARCRLLQRRLKRDHPAVYADLVAGRISSVRKASSRAGLIHLPTRLDALKREWKRASFREREDFVRWPKGSAPGIARAATISPTISSADGRLKRDVVTFLENWMIVHRSKPGRIMRLIGYSVFDYRLAQAMQGLPLHPEIIPKLALWLPRQGYRH
jgi:hypothetical protein